MSLNELTSDTFDEATRTGTSVVDFWAPWCGPCRTLAPVLEDLQEAMPEVSVVKVNVDDSPELAQRFGVMSIPTVIKLTDGQEAKRIVGAMSLIALTKSLELT